jgi:hypothetical protein
MRLIERRCRTFVIFHLGNVEPACSLEMRYANILQRAMIMMCFDEPQVEEVRGRERRIGEDG